MNEEFNRTELRHGLLTAVDAGLVNILLETFSFRPAASRTMAVLRDRGLVTPGGVSPAALTDSGRELLKVWNAEHGPVTS